MNTKRVAFTTAVFTSMILFSIISLIGDRHYGKLDYYDVVSESLLMLITGVLLLLSQKYTGTKSIYYTLTTGISTLFFAFTADLLDEFCSQPSILSYLSDDTGLIIAFLFLLVSAYLWQRRTVSMVSQLYTQANTDGLTGVANRSFLNSELERYCKHSERYHNNFSVIMFDIDHFKKINDTFGHVQGDSVLKEITTLVSNEIREFDLIGRYGGEEFVIILPETNLFGATTTAEKLRRSIDSYNFSGVSKVTASFGVAQQRRGELECELIKRVDNELYNSKDQGRNRVSPHPTTSQQKSVIHFTPRHRRLELCALTTL